ncbi:hypothetical protein PENSPDRAFT_750829 [Peniophora sp. CONT]|nr:hypothetical protein PENSPDRAFT_750829 [Peniophora sp. CONT]
MASAAETHFVQFAVQWASLALLYYDYALTFPDEVKYIWKGRKRSLLVPLYCTNPNAIAHKLGGPSSCDVVYKVIGVVSVLGRAAVFFTFLARVYVVWAKNKLILGFLGALALTCFVLDVIHVPGLRCEGSSTIQIANTLLSILVCIFESLAALMTLLRSIQALRFGGTPIMMKRHTFNYLVAEQSTLYFSLCSALTIGAIVLNFRAPGGFFQRLLNALLLPVSGLLTARFILRLREYHGRDTRKGSADGTPDVSTFEAAVTRQPSNAVIDEFGEDYLALAARRLEEEQGGASSGSLQVDPNEDEKNDWGGPSAVVPTLSDEAKGSGSVPENELQEPEFLQGCSSGTEGGVGV